MVVLGLKNTHMGEKGSGWGNIGEVAKAAKKEERAQRHEEIPTGDDRMDEVEFDDEVRDGLRKIAKGMNYVAKDALVKDALKDQNGPLSNDKEAGRIFRREYNEIKSRFADLMKQAADGVEGAELDSERVAFEMINYIDYAVKKYDLMPRELEEVEGESEDLGAANQEPGATGADSETA